MTGREYTYEMAYGMAKKFGSAMLRMGAKKGDVLCMVVPNIPEFPIAFLGACGVGVTLTTMNPTYRPGIHLREFFIGIQRKSFSTILPFRGNRTSIRNVRLKIRHHNWPFP